MYLWLLFGRINGQNYTEEKEKANILTNFFTEQTLLDDSQATLPQTVKNTTYKLDSIIVTSEGVRDTLKSLSTLYWQSC